MFKRAIAATRARNVRRRGGVGLRVVLAIWFHLTMQIRGTGGNLFFSLTGAMLVSDQQYKDSPVTGPIL
jgi:hypothetical protein